MGADLWDGSPAARRVFDVADDVLGYKLSELCFEGPEDRLRETEYTQPAIFATSLLPASPPPSKPAASPSAPPSWPDTASVSTAPSSRPAL